MNIVDLIEALGQTDAGLFFLAGLDAGKNADPGIVTIHACVGTLADAEKDYLARAVGLYAHGHELHVIEHEAEWLDQAQSLDALAAKFAHDQIIADPTGSFARITALLGLVRQIRKEFAEAFGAILWEPQAASLVLVPHEAAHDHLDEVRRRIDDMIATGADGALDGVINAVEMGPERSGRSYTPVDELPAEKPRRLARPVAVKTLLLKRLVSMATMVGLGTMASAAVPPQGDMDGGAKHLPGVAALIDLTTLGESAFGTRNPYKAAGGLRLFFGESEAIVPEDLGRLGSLGIVEDVPLWPQDTPDIGSGNSEELAQAYGF